MRPKQQQRARHDDLFRARLDQIINMKHELAILADKIGWAWLDAQLAESFSDQGRPAEPVRFMIGMFLLKHTYALSDEQVWARWVHDPCFRYFTGEEFFQHDLPHERSGMSHWRKRIGDKLEVLLQESLRIAHDTGALSKRDLARVTVDTTVDTTVQPKNVTFPTDAKLLETATRQLGKLAKEHDAPLRQSCARLAKRAAMMAGRYAHAKTVQAHEQANQVPAPPPGPDHSRHPTQDRRRRGSAGSLRRSLVQSLANPWPEAAPTRLEALFPARARDPSASARARRTSLVSSASRSRSRRPTGVPGAGSSSSMPGRSPAIPGNPCDGHTLKQVIEETEALTGREIERAYVDKGYRGHDAPKPGRVFRSGQKRGVHGQIKKEPRRRSAHRGGDRPLPDRRPPGAKLPARPTRRPDQRRHERRRLQPPPHPQVAEKTFVENHRRNGDRHNTTISAQTGFLTADYV